MTVRISDLKYLILTLFLFLVSVSCSDKYMTGGSGVLKGEISIGPLCPVETVPPLPGCLPTQETYNVWATAVWTLNKKTKLALLNPKLDGTYEIELPAGEYVIDFDAAHNKGVGGSNLPSVISVSYGDTTFLNIRIDTGIR